MKKNNDTIFTIHSETKGVTKEISSLNKSTAILTLAMELHGSRVGIKPVVDTTAYHVLQDGIILDTIRVQSNG